MRGSRLPLHPAAHMELVRPAAHYTLARFRMQRKDARDLPCRPQIRYQAVTHSCFLKRLDLHFAKLHGSRGSLKRDRSARMLTVINIDGASAIQDYGEVCASRRNFVRVPMVRCF